MMILCNGYDFVQARGFLDEKVCHKADVLVTNHEEANVANFRIRTNHILCEKY